MKKTSADGTMTATGFFTKYDYQKPGIYKNPEGYTQNAWMGTNCPKNRHLSVKELRGIVLEYIKSEKDLSACKWSITTERGGFTQSITFALMAAPFQVTSTEWAEKHGADYHQHADIKKAMTPEGYSLVSKLKSFVSSFNYDDSDGMVDYFDRGFYDHYHVGKWGKSFQVVEPKQKGTEKKNRDGVDLPAIVPAMANVDGVQLVEYSEKAFAIVGNTKTIKGTLKELGGRFNAKLTCGAGWIFSKRAEMKVRAALCL